MDVFIYTVGAIVVVVVVVFLFCFVVVVLLTCWYQVACSHFRF